MSETPTALRIIIVDNRRGRAGTIEDKFIEDSDERIQWVPFVVNVDDPHEALNMIIRKLNDDAEEPEWMQVFLITLDVRYDDEEYAGIETILNGLHRKFDPLIPKARKSLPWEHLFLCTVYMNYPSKHPERVKMLALADNYRIPVDHIFRSPPASIEELVKEARRLARRLLEAQAEAFRENKVLDLEPCSCARIRPPQPVQMP